MNWNKEWKSFNENAIFYSVRSKSAVVVFLSQDVGFTDLSWVASLYKNNSM